MQTQSAQAANGQQSVPTASAQSQADGVSNQNPTNQIPASTLSPTSGASDPQSDTSGAQSQVDGGADQQGDSATTLTREQLIRELERTRREAADHRTARRTLEQEKQERERAQMTREERLAADLADREREKSELVIKHQERAMQYEVQLHAAKLGLIDPDAAVKLLDASRIEYEPDGTPKNIGALLQELAKAKPYLVAAGGQTVTGPTPTNASPTNPASAASRSVFFTEQQIAAMSPQEYNKNRSAIAQAVREGRIKQG